MGVRPLRDLRDVPTGILDSWTGRDAYGPFTVPAYCPALESWPAFSLKETATVLPALWPPRIPGHLMAAGPPLSSVVLPHSISCQWTSCTWEARGSSGSHKNTGQHHGFALEAVGAPHQEAPKPQSRAGGLGRRLPYKVCTPPGNGLAEPLNRKTLSVGSFYRRH